MPVSLWKSDSRFCLASKSLLQVAGTLNEPCGVLFCGLDLQFDISIDCHLRKCIGQVSGHFCIAPLDRDVYDITWVGCIFMPRLDSQFMVDQIVRQAKW